MKPADSVRPQFLPCVRTIALAVMGICLTSCPQHSRPVPESDYSTRIIGSWQGTVGDMKENMSIHRDGTFVCHLRPRGFMANTLSQGVAGTIGGTWKITGALITLNITSAENESLRNRVASSTLVSFQPDEMVLKSDRGETSTFQRVNAL